MIWLQTLSVWQKKLDQLKTTRLFYPKLRKRNWRNSSKSKIRFKMREVETTNQNRFGVCNCLQQVKSKCWTKSWMSSRTNPEICRNPNSGTYPLSTLDQRLSSKWAPKPNYNWNSNWKPALSLMKMRMFMISLNTNKRKKSLIIFYSIDANLNRVKSSRFRRVEVLRCLKKINSWVNRWAFRCSAFLSWIRELCSKLLRKIEPTSEALKLTRTWDLKFAI